MGLTKTPFWDFWGLFYLFLGFKQFLAPGCTTVVVCLLACRWEVRAVRGWLVVFILVEPLADLSDFCGLTHQGSILSFAAGVSADLKFLCFQVRHGV